MKRFLAAIVLCLAFFKVQASHISGGEMYYTYLGTTGTTCHYQVTFNMYIDCLNGQPSAIAADNPAYLAVYTGTGTSGPFTWFESDSVFYALSTTWLVLSDSCIADSTITYCRLKKTFIKDYYLPLSATGYTIVYARCCLNGVISNILDPADEGNTIFCTIPPSGVTASNNSAVFTNYPPNIIALNTPLVFDFSATDADGDSLSYGFVPSLNGADGSNSKPWPGNPAITLGTTWTGPPFNPLTYPSIYKYDTPMSCSVPLIIDPVTGLLTCTPDLAGNYLISVCCHEWRAGVMINTVQREFEFTVTDCPTVSYLDSLRDADIKLFPSPNAGVFTVSGHSQDDTVSLTIFNIMGQKIYSVVLTQQFDDIINATIYLRYVYMVPDGMYFAHITGKHENQVIKFLVAD